MPLAFKTSNNPPPRCYKGLEYEVFIANIRQASTEKGDLPVKVAFYEHAENTWEPISNLENCTDLVRQYEATIKD